MAAYIGRKNKKSDHKGFPFNKGLECVYSYPLKYKTIFTPCVIKISYYFFFTWHSCRSNTEKET